MKRRRCPSCFRRWCIHRVERAGGGGSGSRGGERGGRGFRSGVGAGQSAERRSRHRAGGRTDRTAADAAGRQAGRWGWGWGGEEGWLVAAYSLGRPVRTDTESEEGKKNWVSSTHPVCPVSRHVAAGPTPRCLSLSSPVPSPCRPAS
ncbi:hypothetical protein INR49_023677 [Caranx melampygus]|nr:hypothetical protein INR49_023677 [Caranx melampygus]